MSFVTPFNTSFKLADENGIITVEAKAFFDQILARVGGVTGGQYTQLTDGPSIAWDLDQHPVCVVVLGGNRAFINPTSKIAGPLFPYRLTVVQDATGGRTITWGSDYKFPSGVAPALSTGANAVDELTFDCDGTNMKLIGFSKDIR